MTQRHDDHPAPDAGGTRYEVRWTRSPAPGAGRGTTDGAIGGAGARAFTLTLVPVDDAHALLETWIETVAGGRRLVHRRPVACTAIRRGGLLHVDAAGDARRLVALSFAVDGDAPRLLYAQTPLLADAGLAGGAYDPPSARLAPARTGAASA